MIIEIIRIVSNATAAIIISILIYRFLTKVMDLNYLEHRLNTCEKNIDTLFEHLGGEEGEGEAKEDSEEAP